MFQQQGQERKFLHDIKLASLLSATAGSVNSASFFAFEVLTTNVTGHVALLANELVAKNWGNAQLRLLWMFTFFAGAFVSGVLMETIGAKHSRFSHTIPILLEMSILAFVGWFGANYDYSRGMTQILAGSLLFAMGLQNAMVTMVSGSVIRTTHLTGLFTDIGINFAKFALLGFRPSKNKMLFRRVVLQFLIIASFLGGAIVGGYLFAGYLFQAFAFPLLILFFALFYDALYTRKSKKELLAALKNEPKIEEKVQA